MYSFELCLLNIIFNVSCCIRLEYLCNMEYSSNFAFIVFYILVSRIHANAYQRNVLTMYFKCNKNVFLGGGERAQTTYTYVSKYKINKIKKCIFKVRTLKPLEDYLCLLGVQRLQSDS
jgi:hypothetical protein